MTINFENKQCRREFLYSKEAFRKILIHNGRSARNRNCKNLVLLGVNKSLLSLFLQVDSLASKPFALVEINYVIVISLILVAFGH